MMSLSSSPSSSLTAWMMGSSPSSLRSTTNNNNNNNTNGMTRSESNAELLHLPEHTTPTKVSDFVVDGVGGGLMVAQLYGDFDMSMACIDLGVAYPTTEAALDECMSTASTMNDQCLVTDLNIAGAAIFLYVHRPEHLHSAWHRQQLMQALAVELACQFRQTNVLCLPGQGCTYADLIVLRTASQQQQQQPHGTTTSAATASSPTSSNHLVTTLSKSASCESIAEGTTATQCVDSSSSSDDEEEESDQRKKKANHDPPVSLSNSHPSSNSLLSSAHHRRRRSESLTMVELAFDFPVPAAMVQPPHDNQRDHVPILAQAAAYSTLGALVTLAHDKGYTTKQDQQQPSIRILLVGYSDMTQFLYQLLTNTTTTSSPSPSHEAWHVLVTDPRFDAEVPTKVPLEHVVPWSQRWSTPCDVLCLCATTASRDLIDLRLNATLMDAVPAQALISAVHNVLPRDPADREHLRLALEAKGMFEFADGLCDVGKIACGHALAQKQQPQPPAAVNHNHSRAWQRLGATVMSKRLHLDGIVKEYDTEDKRKFYSMILAEHQRTTASDDDTMGGGLKLLGLGTILHNSADSMTSWMWNRARSLCPAYRALNSHAKDAPLAASQRQCHYLDLGAGNGSAARWICKQDSRIHVHCINISPQQNAENRQLSDEQGFGGQIRVETTSFEQLPTECSSCYDGCLSQDAFIHAFSKLTALSEAFRVTKGGGWLMVCDLVCGEHKDDVNMNKSHMASTEELQAFAEKNNVQNWVTAKEYVELAKKAGWSQVEFIDCTAQIKVSLQGLLTKIQSIIASNKHKGLNLQLLQTHRLSLSNRIGQIDRGVFQWGIIAGRKPYDVLFMAPAPVVPDPHPMMTYSTNHVDGSLKYGTDVVVLNIKDQMRRDTILELPSTVRMIVTMSAGLDHVDVEAAAERGIRVRRAARFQIVKSVADYLLSNIIFGLRNGFQNVGVPFPGKDWDLSWNANGVDLDRAKIGFIGMGAIADETCRRIRALSDDCELVFHIPEGIRCRFEEGTYRMHQIGIADLLSTCDVVIPLMPLTPTTEKFITYSSFAMMKESCIFINMARGKVVDTEGMLKALQEGQIRHAILDTTEPEPLPEGHLLWTLPTATITPHFATNTTYVRKELVEDIPNEIEDTLDERGILRLEEERARKELSDAYRITRDFGMDELVWNHLSVLLSDGSYLITPGNRMFDDIGPMDLVKSSGNVTADIIHDAVYKSRDDIRAIVHLHTPATVAISCLEMGFVPLAQEAAPFVGRVARHPWHGVSNDWEEQALLGEAIKDKTINTLIMENHGFCCFGKTLGEAWVLAYYFDKACQTQLNCLQTGVPIKYPDPKVLAHAAEQALLPEFLPGNCEWEALRKMLTRRGRR